MIDITNTGFVAVPIVIAVIPIASDIFRKDNRTKKIWVRISLPSWLILAMCILNLIFGLMKAHSDAGDIAALHGQLFSVHNQLDSVNNELSQSDIKHEKELKYDDSIQAIRYNKLLAADNDIKAALRNSNMIYDPISKSIFVRYNNQVSNKSQNTMNGSKTAINKPTNNNKMTRDYYMDMLKYWRDQLKNTNAKLDKDKEDLDNAAFYEITKKSNLNDDIKFCKKRIKECNDSIASCNSNLAAFQ